MQRGSDSAEFIIFRKEDEDDRVVTIIIAAVVSVFAGGLMTNQDAAPSIAMDVSIKNSGYFGSSSFLAKVISVSEPIATKDLRITTSWTANNYSSGELDGTITGGATVTASPNVFNWTVGMRNNVYTDMTAPWGYGNGVVDANSGKPNAYSQQFGNYTLIGGVSMYAYPAGQSAGYGGVANSSSEGGYGIGASGDTSGQYYYTNWDGTTHVDGMQAVLGNGWENLRPGDIVSVKMVYIPTGAVIYDANVVVS